MKNIYSTTVLLAALLIGTSLSTVAYSQIATSAGIVLKNADGTNVVNPEHTIPGVNHGNSLTVGTLQSDLDAGYNGTTSADERVQAKTGAVINDGTVRAQTTRTGARINAQGSVNGVTANVNGVRSNNGVTYSTQSNVAGQRVVGTTSTGSVDGSSFAQGAPATNSTSMNAGVTGAVINDGSADENDTTQTGAVINNNNNLSPSAGSSVDAGVSGQINPGITVPNAGGAFGAGSTGAVSGGAMGSASGSTSSSGSANSGAMGGTGSASGSASGSAGGN